MELNEAVTSRRTIRAYKDVKVSEEKIKELVAFAQNAPSWKNSQTARYYAALSEEKHALVREALPAFNQTRSQNATLVAVAFQKGVSGFDTEKNVPANECGDEWGAYDLGLANMLFMLKARELNLDTLIMGIRDGKKIKEALSIPENQEVMAVIAVGERDQEPAMPPRKPLDEILTVL